ncbi:MAG: hypothetical protein IJE78_05965 [Bacteroidaceae bacterium]|nr:hypothetical protein [Bacteroidaceae bacterium]
MAPKIGSQYIIEIEDIYVSASADSIHQRLYKIKGTESLLLTEEEISRFAPLERYNLSMLSDVLQHFTTKKDN